MFNGEDQEIVEKFSDYNFIEIFETGEVLLHLI